MRNKQPTAALIPRGNTLKITGDGPIAANFTKDMVRRLFKLQASPLEPCWSDRHDPTALEIMPRLTKQAYDSFLHAVHSDPRLSAEHEHKQKHFAAFAHPTTAAWPPCDGLMVLESIYIGMPFIMNLIWMLDGSLWVDYPWDSVIRLTETEFAEGYGKTIKEYCEEYMPDRIDQYQRVLSLVAAEGPKRATVSYINKKSEVEKKTMFYWQPDQIEQYLRRHELSHIATDTE